MKDYVGLWFEAYEKLNEPAAIHFILEKNNTQTEIIVPHKLMDGAGALFNLGQENGFTVTPIKKEIKINPPTKWKYFFNCIKFIYWTRSCGNKLWNFKLLKVLEPAITLQSWLTLSLSDSSLLKTKAASQRISLNTLLFHTLDAELSLKFELENKKRSWWIPVNMRSDLGIDPGDPKTQRNYASNFTLDLFGNPTALDTQLKISESLKKQKHWATWWWQLIGRFLPFATIKLIAKNKLANNQHVGAFTNLGEWESVPKDINIVFMAHPLLSHPICASCLIFNGKINLALRIYPTFPLTQDELKKLILTWKQRLFDF